jgi:hypothetical protein
MIICTISGKELSTLKDTLGKKDGERLRKPFSL